VKSTDQHLKVIQDKLQLLLRQYNALQKENLQLKDELSEARMQTKTQQENTDKLKQQVELLKFTNAEMSTEDKKQFEKRINSYLKEIDRCIAMLGQ
jgi:chromosome segregation ATPase